MILQRFIRLSLADWYFMLQLTKPINQANHKRRRRARENSRGEEEKRSKISYSVLYESSKIN